MGGLVYIPIFFPLGLNVNVGELGAKPSSLFTREISKYLPHQPLSLSLSLSQSPLERMKNPRRAVTIVFLKLFP